MITNKLKMDLQNPGSTPMIHAVQNDRDSRSLEISLYSGGKPFVFPENFGVLIRYKKPQGTGGVYDTLPDGTSAWQVRQNLLTIHLANAVFTTPGTVELSVGLLSGQSQVSIFPIRLCVYPAAYAHMEELPEHFHITGFLPAPEKAKTGQYFRIASVDAQGKVTEVEAVDSPASGNCEVDDAYIAQYIEAYLSGVSFVSEESDPTVPAWAKSSSKPTYTAAEVGAMSADTVIPTRLSELVNDLPDTTQLSEGVSAEVSRLTDTVLIREGSRILRFLAVSDAHQKNDNAAITAGNRELGQAVGSVLRQIGVDFVANLGDTTWGSSTADAATVLEEVKTFNQFFLDSVRGQLQIWTEGNHETDKLTDSQIHTLIYSHNKGLTQDADHWIEGYGYMDFPGQKVRVICLNTNQATGSDASGVSDSKLKWFAETALNMEGKTDWSVLTMGHHPLGYNNVSLFRNCVSVVEAFIHGQSLSLTTNSGMTLFVDYSGRNCRYIGHFHGHAHSYSIVRMQKYVSSGVYEEIDAWDICIPNACYERNNQFRNNGEYSARYATEETYSKEDADGKRTAFTVVTICLDEEMIYADHYGAGIDREVSYAFAPAYINQIPLATDSDGSIYGGDYNGDGVNDGYKTDTYLSGGNAGTRTGVECTGFIPMDIAEGCAIYLSGVTAAATDGNFRVAFYDADRDYILQLGGNQLASNGYNIPVVYTTGEDGNINMLDYTDLLAYIKTNNAQTAAFFRLCASEITGSSIITVNAAI